MCAYLCGCAFSRDCVCVCVCMCMHVCLYLLPMTLCKDSPIYLGGSMISCGGMDSYGKPFALQTLKLYCLGTIGSLHSFQIQIPKAFLSIILTKHRRQLRDTESPERLKGLWRRNCVVTHKITFSSTGNHTNYITFCLWELISVWAFFTGYKPLGNLWVTAWGVFALQSSLA